MELDQTGGRDAAITGRQYDACRHSRGVSVIGQLTSSVSTETVNESLCPPYTNARLESRHYGLNDLSNEREQLRWLIGKLEGRLHADFRPIRLGFVRRMNAA